MDPISVGGLVIGVASLGLQVYTGCIQGIHAAAIQLLVTALGYEQEHRYLSLRLRMEQQRLYAWSEASGLLDLDQDNHERVLGSNVFGLHRQTVVDLLVQLQCLFDEFTAHQRRHDNLHPVRAGDGHGGDDDVLGNPERDARLAGFPMSDRKRDFFKKAMAGLRLKSTVGWVRLRWTTLDHDAFEGLLSRFALLNDSMTGLLDHSLQAEMRQTVHDTNRGVLLLHRKMADLGQLVLALKSQLDASAPSASPSSKSSASSREALKQLSSLARFKAFSQTVAPHSGPPSAVDAAAARLLGLELRSSLSASCPASRSLQLARHLVELDEEPAGQVDARSEAWLHDGHGAERQRVWIEWKDYDSGPGSLSRAAVMDRVARLAALLNHSPKPEAFCTPHCLGFVHRAGADVPVQDIDIMDRRLGLVFERPQLGVSLPPVSLRDLMRDKTVRKPCVTERVWLARHLANSLLYLHTVNWLHKGLRSSNVLFFPHAPPHHDPPPPPPPTSGSNPSNVEHDKSNKTSIEHLLRKPCLAGFDFSRPSGSEEMTEAPSGDAAAVESDLYRHPRAQQRERSTKSFDMYSLGVVLVELAHWRTVDDVLDMNLARAARNRELVRGVRDSLVAAPAMAGVGAEMGGRFQDATMACLAGGAELGLRPGDDEEADEVAERLSGRFYEAVVKNLGEIVV